MQWRYWHSTNELYFYGGEPCWEGTCGDLGWEITCGDPCGRSLAEILAGNNFTTNHKTLHQIIEYLHQIVEIDAKTIGTKSTKVDGN